MFFGGSDRPLDWRLSRTVCVGVSSQGCGGIAFVNVAVMLPTLSCRPRSAFCCCVIGVYLFCRVHVPATTHGSSHTARREGGEVRPGPAEGRETSG